jgi:hypothetical protein
MAEVANFSIECQVGCQLIRLQYCYICSKCSSSSSSRSGSSFPYSSKHDIIKFQVECSPLCEIVWLKDGGFISSDDERYTISYGEKPPNYAKNDFESVYSTLHFNIDRWPGGKLDRIIDNANYTCQSTENVPGLEGVSSTTYFRVECKLKIILLLTGWKMMSQFFFRCYFRSPGKY